MRPDHRLLLELRPEVLGAIAGSMGKAIQIGSGVFIPLYQFDERCSTYKACRMSFPG